MKKRIYLYVITPLLLCSLTAFGQDSLHLSLQDAVSKGIDSSKTLMLSETKIQQAINQYEQAKDRQLPQAKASLMGSEAFIPTHKIQIKGVMKEPMELPKTSMMYLGTFGINEAIFAGHKLQYAKESARLLQEAAQLQQKHDKEGVMLSVVHAYINLFKIDQNIKIIQKNISDIEGRLNETQQFQDEGLATLNDVLRFKLEKSQAQLTLVDLQNNRAVANYAMVTLLNFPDNTIIKVDHLEDLPEQINGENNIPPLQHFITQALEERTDLKTYRVQKQINNNEIKTIQADKLPVLGAGINAYYLNPNKQFFPPAHSFLVPVTVGLNLSWDISSLYTSKHKISEANIQHRQIDLAQKTNTDNIRIDVNKNYHSYLQALQRIEVLQTSVEQAKENDRIMELKFQNQLVTTTDRIDAQTMLYKSLIDLGLAKADAVNAWYQLLSSTGTLNQVFSK